MPTKSSVYCEPFEIKDGLDFDINYVEYAHNEDYACFMHFHEVHELIIFENIEGTFHYHQGESQLQNYDVVYTPAMETHDFELSNSAKSWFIVQFPRDLFAHDDLKDEALFFQNGMHMRLSDDKSRELHSIVKFLYKSFSEDPNSNKSMSLLKTLIVTIADGAKPLQPFNGITITHSDSFKRMTPVIDLFRHQLSVELSLQEAAELCHLSPSYFSRLFKKVFRYPYSQYSSRHRLYSAARLLSQTQDSITNISYELNFSSPSHFIQLFKQQFGITPKKYRAEHFLKMA